MRLFYRSAGDIFGGTYSRGHCPIRRRAARHCGLKAVYMLSAGWKSASFYDMISAMKKHALFLCAAALCAAAVCASCSRIMGHGVLLWSIPEQELFGGDIIPVYIKSNINQVYVAAKPGSGGKFEIPLWQITQPVSKKKAELEAEKYREYRYMYARVKYDGLPIRFEPVNTARQVYRLRKDEIIKILYKGSGVEVRSGNSQLEGDWFRVLTGDGTQGWCFSYNLDLYDETHGNSAAEQTAETDAVLDKMIEKKWYPENYASMIRHNKIDLSQMDVSYGFNFGTLTKQVSLSVPGFSRSFPYKGITRSAGNVYVLDETPFTAALHNDDLLAVQYIDEKGMAKSYNFVSLKENIGDLINGELKRRRQLYQSLQSFGPDFSSSNYGILQFADDNRFIWSGYQMLVPDVIPKSAKGTGTAEFKYFLDTPLDVSFDGIITLLFDGAEKEVNFLYKIEEDHQKLRSGLRFESAERAKFAGTTVTARNANALVIFFECAYKEY
ncbi:MAG: SH3 domain-containing protein [Bacteroides sp.]|nr:SH3 domain-containing protein [Prevotella sp.]MCM1408592.1 SH3 domain-containing protein [Treponema brennaborense]MCM1468920.1 SH3 domain-containing protein [Bacteroides sp.]